MMIRFFLGFLLTQSMLFSCALCAYSSPVTHVSVKVNSTDEMIKSIDFKWKISSGFTQQLVEIYDINLNKRIDYEELDLIQTALVEYAKPKNFMTFISYSLENNSKNFLDNSLVKYKTLMHNDTLFFHYMVDVNLPIKANHRLHIYVNDDENYFTLLLNRQFLVFKNKNPIQKEILDNQNIVFVINEASFVSTEDKEESAIQLQQEEQTIPKEETLLESLTLKIKTHLQKVQQGDTVALFVLLLIAFGYGIVHAIGPGHGKALAFSYFASHKSSVFKAFLIALFSSFIHILGALVVVLISIFILKSVLNNFVSDTVFWLTAISAVMIMLLALYLFLRKWKKTSCGCSSCALFQNKKSDLYFVLTAGLIPCAGTVILFIYAFVLKTYLAVFLASIFIALGMAVVIFIASFLGVSVHTLSEKSHKITRILEIVSPLVMFILGALLLASVVL